MEQRTLKFSMSYQFDDSSQWLNFHFVMDVNFDMQEESQDYIKRQQLFLTGGVTELFSGGFFLVVC